MAELLMAGGWVTPDSLGNCLKQTLPDDYAVVADPIVLGYAMGAVVIGPVGVTILQVGNGPVGEEPARRALQGFLKDEFPALKPAIRYLSVERRPGIESPGWDAVEPTTMYAQPVAEAITEADAARGGEGTSGASADSGLIDDATREALALALRDRQLTASMRAAHPFVFRSGGAGGGTKVWTVRAAMAHISRYPEDGIYHLRNGTLAQWLADEGAVHLAKLARAVVQQTHTERHESLELFLIGSELVARPRLAVRPKTVDLGHVLAGESAGSTFRIAKGAGRGYLFGTIEPMEPWLHVEPRSFSGGPVQVVVNADTEMLPIGDAAQTAEIHLHTNASEEPIVVPVRLHVNAMPAPLHRYFVRPLASAASGAALGAAAGLLMQSAGAFPATWPAALARLAAFPFWPVVAALWMLCGLAIGLKQPPAWPVRHAVARWLRYVGAWAAGLIGMALAGTLYWSLVYGTRVGSPLAAISWALGLAVLPGTVHALRANGIAREQAQGEVERPGPRRHRLAIFTGVALVLLLGAPFAVRPALRLWQERVTSAAAQGWVEGTWNDLNTRANGFLDTLYLRYYDRRAPVSPTPAPTTVKPVLGSQTGSGAAVTPTTRP